MESNPQRVRRAGELIRGRGRVCPFLEIKGADHASARVGSRGLASIKGEQSSIKRMSDIGDALAFPCTGSSSSSSSNRTCPVRAPIWLFVTVATVPSRCSVILGKKRAAASHTTRQCRKQMVLIDFLGERAVCCY